MARTILDPVYVRTRAVEPVSRQGGATVLPDLPSGSSRASLADVPAGLLATSDSENVAAQEVSISGGGEQPEQFIWRDRLYVVRTVLGYWRERQDWWSRVEALAVHGDDEPPPTVADAAACGDREVWRVQATAGRRSSGVFELCADGAGPSAGREWRLLRVED